MSENVPARTGEGALAHRIDLAETQALGALLAKSGYFQDAREAAQAAVKVMAGAELGLPPIASMMGINIIKGKVALGAHLIAAQVRRHGYDVRVKQLDAKGCVLSFLDKEDAKGKRGELGESSFQEADAKAAKCFSEMYEKFPRNMYYSRAISNGARWFTPEIFGGAPIFTPEELGAPVDSEGEIIQPAAQPAASAATPAAAKLAAVKQPDPPKPVEPAVPEMLLAIYDRARDFESTVNVIAEFKAAIAELTGAEADYYRILASHGMKHGNELRGRTRGEIKQLIRELYDFCANVSTPPPPSEDRSDWLPENLGGSDAKA